MDTIIRNGIIVDGTGKPRYTADIGIENGFIKKIAKSIGEKADQEIDATGLMVTPGFIDTHAHSDTIAMVEMEAYGSLEQGITTMVSGNCGDSPAPCDKFKMQSCWDITEAEAKAAEKYCGKSSDFMAHAIDHKMGVNTAFMVGHNAVRYKVMGDSDAEPTEAQLSEMKAYVEDAMKGGMFGFSSGLVYAPSVYGKTEELIELAKVSAKYDGVYASHIRGEGDHVMEAIDEALKIGQESGARVIISHLKIMGEKNRGRAREILEKIHQANENGVFVRADQYPYDTGSAPLVTQIPPKYLTKGIPETLKMLADPEMRKKIEYSIFNEADEFESCLYFAGYKDSKIVIAAKTPQYVGKTLSEIAKEENRPEIDVMADMLIANDGLVQGIYRCMGMEDILAIMSDPMVYTGCDWSAVRTRFDREQKSGGHPRGFSTMIKRIETVRDNGLRSAEDSIFSMTGGPANAFGIKDRGVLREGYAADICIIDYPNVKTQSSFEYPFRKNLGLEYVFVNGELTVRDGNSLGKLAGKTLIHR